MLYKCSLTSQAYKTSLMDRYASASSFAMWPNTSHILLGTHVTIDWLYDPLFIKGKCLQLIFYYTGQSTWALVNWLFIKDELPVPRQFIHNEALEQRPLYHNKLQMSRAPGNSSKTRLLSMGYLSKTNCQWPGNSSRAKSLSHSFRTNSQCQGNLSRTKPWSIGSTLS